MGNKSAKKSARDTMWPEIRKLYIFGRLDAEKRKTVYPSQSDLSKQFGIPTGTIGKRSIKGRWLEKREKRQKEIDEAKDNEVTQTLIKALSALREQDLLILEGVIENFLARMVAGGIKVTTHEALRAIQLRQEIHYDHYGIGKNDDSKLPDVNIETNVALGVSIDISSLPEDERDKIYNITGRNQIRRSREQSESLENATVAEYTASLDS